MQHKNIHSQQANEIYASFNWLAWVCKDWLSRGSVILHIKTSSISKWNMRLQQPFANSNSWYLCSPCHPACECAGKSHGDRPARKISWQVCYARNIRKIRLNTWEITILHYYMPWPCISIIACTILWVISAAYKHIDMAVLRCHSSMRVALNDLAHDAHGIQKLAKMCENTFQILWELALSTFTCFPWHTPTLAASF